MKFGWRPTPHHRPRLHLADYMRYPARHMAVPDVFDYAIQGVAPGMLGNDQYGDCVEAGMLHGVQVVTDNGYMPTAQDALSLYHTLTGWNPQDPNSDQGTVIADALTYWQTNPIAPAYHRQLNAHLSVDVNNQALINAAIWLSGFVLIGFEVPYSAQQQFQNGQIWDVVPGSPIVGGHCINMTGVAPGSRKGVSWGREIEMTDAFWNTYVQEAWMVCDEDWVSSYGGKAANALDFSAINLDFQELWPGQPLPFSDPGNPTPPTPPTPGKDPIAALQQIQGITQAFFTTSRPQIRGPLG